MLKLILIILFTSSLYSQREYYNWYFGDYRAITFNTPNLKPKFLNDSKNINAVWGYPTSISDKFGNLLFTIDNYSIKDKKHNEIYIFKRDLITNVREDKTVKFCIKKPESTNLYYVFMQSWWTQSTKYHINNDSTDGLFYWVYDIDKDELIEKNVFIEDSLYSNFEITSHKNGIDFWLITSNYKTGDLYSYQITKDGISKNPVISLNNNLLDSVVPFEITISPNSKKIAISYFNYDNYMGYAFLADFDNENGIISNKSFINTELKDQYYLAAYSCEFSPDNRNLYFAYAVSSPTGGNFNKLYQYRMSSKNNQFNLDSTSQFVYNFKQFYNVDMELGPNGKIYMQGKNNDYLLFISNPSNHYSAIKIDTLFLDTGKHKVRLPKTIKSLNSFLAINHYQEICEFEDLKLNVDPTYFMLDVLYSWEGPNGFYSTEKNPIIENITKAQEGYYKVKVYNYLDTLIDSTLVTVNERTDIELIKSKEILCPKDSLIIFTKENFDILWNNNITSKSFTVYNSGTYTASYIDSNKCESTKSIIIEKYDLNPKITTTKNHFCYGDSTTLSLDKDYDTIIWNTGESTKDLIVKESGVYSATVTQGECINDTSIVINVNPLPTLDIEAPNGTILCDDGSVEINVQVPPNTKIQWNDGISLDSRTFNQSGTYSITSENLTTGCKNTKSIEISDIDNSIAKILGNSAFCDGESTTLTIQPQGKSYLWNNGETTQSIVINNSGLYSATITTDTDCKIDANIEVTKNPIPTFQILGKTLICDNETTIYPNKDFEFYKWSNGETSKSITIDKSGNYDLTVIDNNGCKATQSITITEFTPEINLSNRNIDFGELLFGDTKLENISSERDIIFIKNSNIFDVNFQDTNINISFNPKDIGEFIDTLIIENTGDCKALDTIYIQGICKAEILAKVGNSEGYPGDLVNNTVNLELLQNIPLPKDFNYEIDIQINQDAIQIQDATTFNYKNNKLEINIADYLNKTSYDEKIKDINSKIMLSKNLENELLITKFTTDNQHLIPIRQNGNLKIYEVCLYEARLIENYNEALIKQITQTKTTLTTYYAGKYTIEITDISGKTITKEVTTASDNEEINFNYKLSNGTYIIKITEPGKTQTRKIIFN
jgi:hypothetical protein